MANYSKELEDRNFAPSVREARQERRLERQRLIYSKLRDALNEEDETSTHQRFAGGSFNYDPTARDSTSIPSGVHPGDAAVGVVYSLLADYRLPAEIKLRYSGMDRKAGRGGHGISEGTIFVEGLVKPVKGMTNYITFPIVVTGSRLLPPSVLFLNGVPRVIAQSTFDDILTNGEIDHEAFLSNYDKNHHVVPSTRTKTSSINRDALRDALRGWKRIGHDDPMLSPWKTPQEHPTKPRFEVEEESTGGKFDFDDPDQFLADNDNDEEIEYALKHLGPGQETSLGGGAQPIYVLRRLK